nr:unnamed protein product [Callosobruchus analis]
MTYINKKTRTFMERGDWKPERRRSEARLKTYPSSEDIRNWCDEVEDRRQHILELVVKGYNKCRGSLIPLEALLDILMANKMKDLNSCQKYVDQLLAFIDSLDLSPEDLARLSNLKQKMDQKGSPIKVKGKECPAKARHDREKQSVDDIVRDAMYPNSYQVKTKGPARTVMKIKGIKPGFKVQPVVTYPPDGVATKAQTTVTGAYPVSGKYAPTASGQQQSAEDEQDGSPSSPPVTSQGSRAGSPSKKGATGKKGKMPSQDGGAQLDDEAPAPVTTTPRGAGTPRGANVPQTTSMPETLGVPKSTSVARSPAVSYATNTAQPVSKTTSIPQGGPPTPASPPGDSSQPQSGRSAPTARSMPQGGISAPADSFVPHGSLEEQISQLQDELAARDALCNEQQASIEKLKEERGNLQNKIESCLAELESLKNMNNVDNPVLPSSCQEEIEALEQEMKIMRSGNLPPEQEAEIIKKEVDVLKRYCMKLKEIESENEKLKSGMKSGGSAGPAPKGDSAEMESLMKERDELAKKVEQLENELKQLRGGKSDDKQSDDVYKDRTDMLDKALAERDELRKKLDDIEKAQGDIIELKKKADKADELERQLKSQSKSDRSSTIELKKTKSKCMCLEQELRNCRMEKDAMSKRIEYMKSEIDSMKLKAKECEMLKLERDRLQIKLNELSHVQVHNENLMLKCKCLEAAAGERDLYKQKYEQMVNMECTCETARMQLEDARLVARERDALVKQVGDLESCIRDQEEEIRCCMCEIETLKKNKDATQIRMKEALTTMRAEVEKKDQLIAASEEKLTTLQQQLKSSIQGVSCETLCYKTRIEELERELCHAKCQIKILQDKVKNKDMSISGAKNINRNEQDQMAMMARELEAARAENRKLQEIANKMVSLTGDEHVQKMLKQSECAVKRVVEELSKQYQEWDTMKHRNQKSKLGGTRCCCSPGFTEGTDFSDSESDMLIKGDLEDIQREKEKLEKLVRQIQTDRNADTSTKEIAKLKLTNAKLQEQLQKEIKARKEMQEKMKY